MPLHLATACILFKCISQNKIFTSASKFSNSSHESLFCDISANSVIPHLTTLILQLHNTRPECALFFCEAFISNKHDWPSDWTAHYEEIIDSFLTQNSIPTADIQSCYNFFRTPEKFVDLAILMTSRLQMFESNNRLLFNEFIKFKERIQLLNSFTTTQTIQILPSVL